MNLEDNYIYKKRSLSKKTSFLGKVRINPFDSNLYQYVL